MNDEQKEILEIHLHEYDKLKEEQIQRIQFRDQLIYITLGVFGGILAFALGENSNPYAIIVFPWVSVVLGWTYLINDEKTSRIGEYIRDELSPRIEELFSKEIVGKTKPIFCWEKYYREKGQRNSRKIVQLAINEITFVFSGIFILQAFSYLIPEPQGIVLNILIAECFFLILLGLAIFVYADLDLPIVNLIKKKIKSLQPKSRSHIAPTKK